MIGGAPLLGRTIEMQILNDALRASCAGRGSVVVVEGEAGIGKSSILAAASAEAESLGMQLRRGSAEELERQRPFGALADAFDFQPGSLSPGLARIGRALVGWEPASEFQIIEELLAHVEALAEAGPLLVTIDDLHWADTSTLRSLRALGKRFARAPVAIVVAARRAPRPRELAELLRRFESDGATRLSVPPLDAVAGRELAEALLGVAPGPRLVRLLDGTAGNPLFVTQLLFHLGETGQLAMSADSAEITTEAIPRSLRAVVLDGLAPFEPETARLLRTCALLGTRFRLDHLAIVAGRPATQVLVALADTFTHHVLEGTDEAVGFRHDLIREVIYQDIPSDVRRVLHHDAGRALGESGAPALDVAWHYARGALPGDATAIQWLRRAADEEATRAPAVTIGLLQRVSELLPAGSVEQDEVHLDLLRPLVDRGDVDDAVDLARDVLRRRHAPNVLARAHRLLSHALLISGDLAGARATLDHALTTVGLSAHDRASLLADQTNLVLEPVEAIRLGELALEEAAAGNNAVARVRVLVTLSPKRTPVKAALDAAVQAVSEARALDVGTHRDTEAIYLLGDALFLRAHIRLQMDQLDAAMDDLHEARLLAERIGAIGYIPIIYDQIATALWQSGGWDDALAEISTGLSICEDTVVVAPVAALASKAAHIHAHRGHAAEAAALLDRASASREGLTEPASPWLAYARSALAELGGDAPGALAHARDAVAGGHPSARVDVVRLAVALDDDALAWEAVRHAEEATAPDRATRHNEAIALRARAWAEQDPEVAMAAVAVARCCQRPMLLASSCEEAARLLLRVERSDEARAHATEALETFAALGASWDIARVENMLRAVGVRTGPKARHTRASSGWLSLTPTEERVVALVGEGLSNAEIGARLFISPRTVSTHLTRVFAKLDVSSRTQLAIQLTSGAPGARAHTPT